MKNLNITPAKMAALLDAIEAAEAATTFVFANGLEDESWATDEMDMLNSIAFNMEDDLGLNP